MDTTPTPSTRCSNSASRSSDIPALDCSPRPLPSRKSFRSSSWRSVSSPRRPAFPARRPPAACCRCCSASRSRRSCASCSTSRIASWRRRALPVVPSSSCSTLNCRWRRSRSDASPPRRRSSKGCASCWGMFGGLGTRAGR
uniref:(northern house mosquito) hypothetical protein n=1 Tax=Culex pipiens TaxID=7175 RepID=A0A8D8BQK6_CULPI